MAETPVLQIIHVTDMHVQVGRDERNDIALAGAKFALWFREKLERFNIFGWHDGTRGHNVSALTDFEKFLITHRKAEPQWFSSSAENGAVTWLIDTGDATRAGMVDSFKSAGNMLAKWKKLLAPCDMRSIFGNHDAWPGMQPTLAARDYNTLIANQRNLIDDQTVDGINVWRTADWLAPLLVNDKAGKPLIECYGLNSVLFGLQDNVAAVGEIEQADLDKLKQVIENRHQTCGRAYRILLTHHPVIYPYRWHQKILPVGLQMVMRNSKKVREFLLNAYGAKNLPVPFVHMILSGHTHFAWPGNGLPDTVQDVKQPGLGRTLLQLVGGSLMLNRSRADKAPKNDVESEDTRHSEFSDPTVFKASQQFQILQFFSDPERPEGLWLDRRVIARTPIRSSGYTQIGRLKSRTFVVFEG
jgi:3',5'-cyclic AMP phosphodiesterase CpdA